MNNKVLKIVLVLVCIVVITSIGIAQPPAGPLPGGGTGGTPPCWAPECVPIDGGLSFLLAAGALLGFKSLKGKK